VRSTDQLAASVVRGWTRLYTAGLEPLLRNSRRAEIDSDLWEHAQAGSRGAAPAGAIAGQILARCLLGVGADVTWRAETAMLARYEKGGVAMKERMRRDWWVPAPVVMVAIGVLVVVTHFVGDGTESWWSRTDDGWNPTSPQRAGAVLALALFFVVLPVWALAVRRSHPARTLVMLLPWVLLSLTPLVWGAWGGILLIPVLGIATLVGAIANVAHHAVRQDLSARPAPGGLTRKVG